MGIARTDCKVKKIDRDTPGGDTYFVLLPGESHSRPLCFRRKKANEDEPDEMRCTNPAGFGTWHAGTGACKFHGGSAGRNLSFKHGKYALKSRVRLADRINEYLEKDRSKLLDLTNELATVRAMFDEFMENFPDPTEENYGTAFFRFNTIISTLGTLVEKISKIESRNTLTTAQVLYLRATVTDILMKYLPDPSVRERAAIELATRMGGDVSVEMHKSEVNMHNMLEA